VDAARCAPYLPQTKPTGKPAISKQIAPPTEQQLYHLNMLLTYPGMRCATIYRAAHADAQLAAAVGRQQPRLGGFHRCMARFHMKAACS
jgi:hypothetical protein